MPEVIDLGDWRAELVLKPRALQLKVTSGHPCVFVVH